MTNLTQHLGNQAALLSPSSGSPPEALFRKRASAAFRESRVGGLLELDAVKQFLNVAGNRIRSHDEHCIKRMDVYLLVTELLAWPTSAAMVTGEAKIVRDAGE